MRGSTRTRNDHTVQPPPVVADAGALLDTLDQIRDRLVAGERSSVLFGAEPVDIEADVPTEYEYELEHFASIALYNPTGSTLYIGEGSASGVAGREFAIVPAGTCICLPMRGRRLSLGLGDSSAGTVYVFPFRLAQPFSFTLLAIDGGGP